MSSVIFALHKTCLTSARLTNLTMIPRDCHNLEGSCKGSIVEAIKLIKNNIRHIQLYRPLRLAALTEHMSCVS